MNSESERKSPQELQAIARQSMQTAEMAIPCVTVTEQNWRALTTAMQMQLMLLEKLQTAQSTLSTKQELTGLLQQQNETLSAYSFFKSYTM